MADLVNFKLQKRKVNQVHAFTNANKSFICYRTRITEDANAYIRSHLAGQNNSVCVAGAGQPRARTMAAPQPAAAAGPQQAGIIDLNGTQYVVLAE